MKSTLLPVAMVGLLFCAHSVAEELETVPSPEFVDANTRLAQAETPSEVATETAPPDADTSAETESAPAQDTLDETRPYGPVQPGESLSTIAIAISEATGIHVAQVMWGLYVASPDAFKGSINRLRIGSTLTVPTATELTAVSIRQARINIRDAAAAKTATAAPEPAPQATPTAATPSTPLPRAATPTPAPTPAVTRPARAESPAASAPATRPTEATILVPAISPERAAREAEQSRPTSVPPAPADDAPADDNALLSGRQLILPLIALAGFVVAMFLGARRRRIERAEAEKVEQEAAVRKRSELVNLARGEYEDEDDATQVIPTIPTAESAAVTETAADASAGPDNSAAVAEQSREQPVEEPSTESIEATQVIPVVPPATATDDATLAADADADLESFDDGINDGDDINSALDLAQGYAGMGEIDRARALLQTVIERGTPEQQAEARKVLDSLS